MITSYSNTIAVTTSIPTLLLDLYPSAAVAYSLRKLSSTYTGDAIRVRRASDNTEQNIGFDALGNLNTTALTAFCSGTNGFVTTWYDQSGNGANVTQSTASNQPQIVSSGGVILENGKPAISFNGSSNFLSKSGIGSGKSITNFNVFRHNNLLNNPAIFAIGITAVSTSKLFGHNSTSGFYRAFAGNNLSYNASTVSNTSYLGFTYFSGVNSQIALNGGASVTGNAGTNDNTDIAIGAGLAGSNYMNGTIQEHISYGSNQISNRSLIESNINTYYAIY